ncbi:MAG TPA: LuxR C-terminal-related transcriptional regulator, partial [Anaerovoracaceae bacterium]|nr:LuxR C-terminal-related transcriptional regulator [Anaerovoracaceae bacterium]
MLYYNEQASLYCREIAVSQSVQGAISQVLNMIIEKIIGRIFNTAILLHSFKITVMPQIIPGPNGSFDTIYIIYLSSSDRLNDRVFEKLGENYGLSNREQEIIRLIYNGFSNQEIAQKYYISIHTV